LSRSVFHTHRKDSLPFHLRCQGGSRHPKSAPGRSQWIRAGCGGAKETQKVESELLKNAPNSANHETASQPPYTTAPSASVGVLSGLAVDERDAAWRMGGSREQRASGIRGLRQPRAVECLSPTRLGLLCVTHHFCSPSASHLPSSRLHSRNAQLVAETDVLNGALPHDTQPEPLIHCRFTLV
jgi:hypothetical protein